MAYPYATGNSNRTLLSALLRALARSYHFNSSILCSERLKDMLCIVTRSLGDCSYDSLDRVLSIDRVSELIGDEAEIKRRGSRSVRA